MWKVPATYYETQRHLWLDFFPIALVFIEHLQLGSGRANELVYLAPSCTPRCQHNVWHIREHKDQVILPPKCLKSLNLS